MNIRKLTKNKGITLIALIITIIVMLILVAVTINMAIKGNLFGNAGKAAGDMKNAIDKEKSLANGGIKIGDKYYTIDEYLEQIGNNNNRIKLTYTITPAEDNLSAVITVKAIMLGGLLEDGEEYESYESYALKKLEGKTDEEIEQIFVEGFNYWNEANGGVMPIFDNINDLVVYVSENFCEGSFNDVDGMVAAFGCESLTELAIGMQCVYPEGYNWDEWDEYENYLADRKLNMMDPAGRVYNNTNTLEYTVYRDGKYTFIASNESGTASNSITVKIDNIYEEKFSAIYKENTPITQGSYTAVIPKGFAVGISEGINKIETGLVITDAVDSEGHSIGNEFVWIPVTSNLGSSYSYSSNYSEPTELTRNDSSSSAAYDSQATLDYLYGANYYNYEEDFKYADEYAEMVRCVNANHGFYIGRYEATKDDDGSIGSKYSTTVLTAGTTYTYNSTTYYYRWYGLYYASKNANITGNGSSVQTAMIYGVLYDKAMDFIRTQKTAGKTTYDVDIATDTWHTGSSVVDSGRSNPGATGDVALNIWDLESNAYEWTQEAYSSGNRFFRGGSNSYSNSASVRSYSNPTYGFASVSSRLALYIK